MVDSESITIEGRWAVEAALASDFVRVDSVFLEEGKHLDLSAVAVEGGAKLHVLSRDEIADQAGYDFHRGVFATADRPKVELTDEWLSELAWLVVPAGLGDGGNLGTIVRSAVAFGANGVLIEQGRGADIYSRKCIRSSATAIFRVPVFEVSSLVESLARFSIAGGEIFGTTLEEDSTPLPDVMIPPKAAILLGAEKDGLTAELKSACDEMIHLPMKAGMDSLNVAATAAIVLYELLGRDPGAQ